LLLCCLFGLGVGDFKDWVLMNFRDLGDFGYDLMSLVLLFVQVLDLYFHWLNLGLLLSWLVLFLEFYVMLFGLPFLLHFDLLEWLFCFGLDWIALLHLLNFNLRRNNLCNDWGNNLFDSWRGHLFDSWRDHLFDSWRDHLLNWGNDLLFFFLFSGLLLGTAQQLLHHQFLHVVLIFLLFGLLWRNFHALRQIDWNLLRGLDWLRPCELSGLLGIGLRFGLGDLLVHDFKDVCLMEAPWVVGDGRDNGGISPVEVRGLSLDFR
jgi:hypothetical protein